MRYSEGFRTRMIERLAGPGRISACALAKEVGVCQNTLSRWLREASMLSPMGSKQSMKQDAQRSPRKWSGAGKLQAVLDAAGIPDAELGEFLRKKGIHEADLKAWREVVTRAAVDALQGAGKAEKLSAAATRRIRDLEQEVARKEKRLKAATALLDLQKKSAKSGRTRKSPLPRGASDDPSAP